MQKKKFYFIFQERTLFVWGFDRATSLDELIDFFETEFPNVVNMRQRTAISDDDEKVIFNVVQFYEIFVDKKILTRKVDLWSFFTSKTS